MIPPVPAPVTIVTGVPRSGTSLLMQILAAAGLPLFTDGARPPDGGNPRGYCEHELVKTLPRDVSWLPSARGRAVKIIHSLVPFLPPTETYRVLVLQRAWPEVLASQRALLSRLGRPAPVLSDAELTDLYEKQSTSLLRWLDAQPHVRRIVVSHRALVHAPADTLPSLAAFLGDTALDWTHARDVIAPALHRERSGDPARF
jgi:hypothetical protein